jgi:hypothetical protein
MSAMQQQLPETSDEITVFIIEGTHRLAIISINDYGYLLSTRMALTYLVRATEVLESKPSFDRVFITEANVLKAMASAIARDYAQFETFCRDCERFDHLETKNWIEWISKFAVRTISKGYCGRVGHHLAYRICRFHSRVSSLLTER